MPEQPRIEWHDLKPEPNWARIKMAVDDLIAVIDYELDRNYVAGTQKLLVVTGELRGLLQAVRHILNLLPHTDSKRS